MSVAKDYYQTNNGGFRLEPSTYRAMSWFARRYPFFIQRVEEIENMNPLKIKERDIIDKAALEKHISILESTLERYVEEGYREAVKEHCWYAVEYIDLEEKYFVSTGSMKRAVQKYIFGLAEEYGENFSRNG